MKIVFGQTEKGLQNGLDEIEKGHKRWPQP